jgi:hypothetical protein
VSLAGIGGPEDMHSAVENEATLRLGHKQRGAVRVLSWIVGSGRRHIEKARQHVWRGGLQHQRELERLPNLRRSRDCQVQHHDGRRFPLREGEKLVRGEMQRFGVPVDHRRDMSLRTCSERSRCEERALFRR